MRRAMDRDDFGHTALMGRIVCRNSGKIEGKVVIWLTKVTRQCTPGLRVFRGRFLGHQNFWDAYG